MNVTVFGDEVTVVANPEELKSLAERLLALAAPEVLDGTHVFLDPGVELENKSALLIVVRKKI